MRPRGENIFGTLNTDSAKTFTKGLRELFSAKLSEIKKLDDDITQKKFWDDVLNIKGNLFQKPVNIADLIQQAQRIVITGNSAAENSLRQLIGDFIALEGMEKYRVLIGQPGKSAVESSTRKHASSSATLFSDKDRERKIELEQINTIDNTREDKKEMLLLLMEIAAPPDYNGHFVDFEQDISSKVDVNDFADIQVPRERLAAIESARDKLLAEKIDSLIDEAKAENKDRINIILKTGIHYTAIDIDVRINHLIVMDASEDLRAKRFETIDKYSRYLKSSDITFVQNQGYSVGDRVVMGASIQKAEFGCSIFSLAHSFSMAKQRDFHTHVRNNNISGIGNNVNRIDWIHFLPDIVCMSQSTTFIAYYMKMNPRFSENIMRLTNNNKRNFGFERHLQNFREKVASYYATRSLGISK